ncbi:MAG: hypothetical protein NC517_03665 [Firmicutes bacterium]|nr:hypothetical protein [Bacillota bacterium]
MEEKGRKVFRKVRNFAVVGLAGCLLTGGSMEAFAASLQDVFDEHYYADTYGDLKEAFGYNREVLWNHFITYGLSEGRTMNEFIDVVKYREEYGDLAEAFGDDWDAYLNHYLIYGAKEGRDTGTDFNALDYAGRYEDLAEAFGDDVLALWKHYQTSGKTEKRKARAEKIIVEERTAEEARKAQENRKKEGYEVREELPDGGGWVIHKYDSADREIKYTQYDANGTMSFYGEYEYDSAGTRIATITGYDADGNVTGTTTRKYDADGNVINE